MAKQDHPERGIDPGPSAPIPAAKGPPPGEAHTAGPKESLEGQAGPVAPSVTNPDAPSGKARYRVKGPGSVKINGVFFPEGSELDLAKAEAQGLDGHLEFIQDVHRGTSRR